MPTNEPPPYFLLERGQMTFVAANGDELYVECTGQQNDALDMTDPQPMKLVGHCTITGGTGRFANATGSFEKRGVVRLPPGGLEAPDWRSLLTLPVHFDLEGEISF